jgi:oxepin-CoA hydrolase/3-oxo-5,6-dehydrosuberyl-CoA semialdehyde dehydrogenase
MDTVKLDFITHGFISLLKDLPVNAGGKWGKMNAQQMVEHVTGFFKVSANKVQFPLVSPSEHMPKLRAFLHSDKEFRENTKAPTSVIGEEPLPVRSNNMEEAITGLQQSIDEFVDYFEGDSYKTTLHPVFGELNFDEWILLHYKHLVHHAKQFGLIE